jgi:hypothetical protein
MLEWRPGAVAEGAVGLATRCQRLQRCRPAFAKALSHPLAARLPHPPPRRPALDEDGHEARNNAAESAADAGAPPPSAGTPGNGKPLGPMPGQLGAETGVPAPEAVAAAAGAASGVGPDLIIAVARGDASTAAK